MSGTKICEGVPPQLLLLCTYPGAHSLTQSPVRAAGGGRLVSLISRQKEREDGAKDSPLSASPGDTHFSRSTRHGMCYLFIFLASFLGIWV